MTDVIVFEDEMNSAGGNGTGTGLTMIELMFVVSVLVFLAFVIKLLVVTLVSLFHTALALVFLYFMIK